MACRRDRAWEGEKEEEVEGGGRKGEWVGAEGANGYWRLKHRVGVVIEIMTHN